MIQYFNSKQTINWTSNNISTKKLERIHAN